PLYSTKARGLGLGLSIARSILEKNHGSLRVASEPGRGSTFTVLLQAAVPRPPAAQAQGMHPLGPSGGGGGAHDTEGKGGPGAPRGLGSGWSTTTWPPAATCRTSSPTWVIRWTPPTTGPRPWNWCGGGPTTWPCST